MRNPDIVKERKRRIVAAGKIAGEKAAKIAASGKMSKRHVERLAAEPETQFLITKSLQPYQAKLVKLLPAVIAAIAGALKAKKTDKADHFSRLRGVERFRDLLDLAQGGKPPELPEQTGTPQYTWEEFVALYARRIIVKTDSSNPETPR
jgi:hypothetical protein